MICRKSPSLSTNQLTTSLFNHTNYTGNNKNEKLNTWFPLTFTLDVNTDGQVVISNECTAENTQMTTHCGSSNNEDDAATKLEYLKIEESIKTESDREKTSKENGYVEKVTNENGDDDKRENGKSEEKNGEFLEVLFHFHRFLKFLFHFYQILTFVSGSFSITFFSVFFHF